MNGDIRLPAEWQMWEITELLGSGSYGTVYKARLKAPNEDAAKNASNLKEPLNSAETEIQSAQYSAIKIIKLPADENELETMSREYPKRQDLTNYYINLVEDLRAEIDAMELLRDVPNIVTMQDYKIEHEEGTLEWTIYIRMELLTPFSQYKDEFDGVFGEKETLKLGIDICGALEACQKNNIIHRDIKPENIMVSSEGVFKLGDFGIVKRLEHTTGSMSLKGTFTYMAPEVYHGQKYDARVDQYSLGIVLYRLLNNNREPFLDASAPMIYFKDRKEALQKRMDGEVPESPVNASESLGRVIRKACSYRPENRYESPSEFKADLEKCLAGADVTVSDLIEISEDEQEQLRKRRLRIKKKLALMVAAAAVAVGVIVTAFVLTRKSVDELILEQSNATEQLIRENGVQRDDNLSTFDGYADAAAYQSEINDYGENPKSESAIERVQAYIDSLKSQNSYSLDNGYDNSRIFAAYLDDEYCAVGLVYYNVEVDGETRRERVDHNTDVYYLKKNIIGEWQICLSEDEEDIKTIQDRMNEIYLPDGYADAEVSGRNIYIDEMELAYWVGDGALFADEENASANMELAAAWQNEDGSVDAYFICRNATEYETPFMSYWLQLNDSELGDVLLGYGHMNAVVPENSSEGFMLHFEAGDIISGAEQWTELSNYFTGLNTNENL